MMDALKPYLLIIRLALYAILIAFLFVSGCNYGKHRQEVTVNNLKSEIESYRDANKANQDAIDLLTEANRAYALESAKQLEKVASIQKELKRAQAHAQARESALQKELKREYSKNRAWADTPVPDSIRLLIESSKN